jgi:hypothetical protein
MLPLEVRRRQARIMGQNDPWTSTTVAAPTGSGGGGGFTGARPKPGSPMYVWASVARMLAGGS